MTRDLTPEHLQELAAGYVLGDLSSDEAVLFQEQLRQRRDLVEEVERLQAVLGAIPYGLPEIDPPPPLRDRLLSAVERDLSTGKLGEPDSIGDRGSVVPLTTRRIASRRRWQTAVSGIAAVAAIALFADNLRLRQDLQILEARQSWQDSEFATMVVPSETVLANQWDGLDRLVDDHTSAMSRPQGPMDYNASDVVAIVERFDRQFAFPDRTPVIASRSVKLMGGSLCAFGKIYGLRYTYHTDDGSTLSFYQIDTRQETLSIPETGSGKLYVSQPGKPQIVLWSDDRYVYAIVAELPGDRLKTLSTEVIMQ